MPSGLSAGVARGWVRRLLGVGRTAPKPAAAPANPSTGERIPDLDGLRAVAILLVVLFHGLTPVWLLTSSGGYPFAAADWTVYQALHAGWAGVDLFFVLSGFLITGILLRAKGEPGYYKNFYLRRTFRIMPLYYAILGVWLVLSYTSVEWLAVGTGEWVACALYLSNYWRPFAVWAGFTPVTGSLAICWSLAIEEQFYLVWPLVVALTPRAWLGRVCAAGVAVALGCRWGLTAAQMDPWYTYAFAPCRMDALLLGAMVALMVANGASRRTLVRRALVLLVVAGGAAAYVCVKSGGPFCHAPRVASFGYTAFDGVFAALLMLVVAGQPRGWGVLRSRALRLIGTHSYAIYLVHVPITFLGVEVFKTEAVRAVLLPPSQALGTFAPLFVAYYAFVVGLSLLVARVTWVVIERPFLRLKDRYPMGERPRPARVTR